MIKKDILYDTDLYTQGYFFIFKPVGQLPIYYEDYRWGITGLIKKNTIKSSVTVNFCLVKKFRKQNKNIKKTHYEMQNSKFCHSLRRE